MEMNLLKNNRPFTPLHAPEVLTVLILLFMTPPSAFNFDTLSGGAESSIPRWSLCSAVVWPPVGEQSDSPDCHLSPLGGCQEAGSGSVEITVHSEQDATTIIFLSLTLSIFKGS